MHVAEPVHSKVHTPAEVAMDQKGWNEEDDTELKVLLGPLPLPQKGDWINAEDRAWIKNQWRVTPRVGKRDGWQEWMYTLRGPPEHLQEAKQELLRRFEVNREKPKPEKIEGRGAVHAERKEKDKATVEC